MTTRFDHSVVLAAEADAVWDRAVTPAGINHEMKPWVTMTMPRKAHGLTVDTLTLGQPVGRAWLRLFGVLLFDYDRLVLVEREPGRRFLERSTMLSMRRWEHERTLTPVAGGTRVTDRIAFEPRLLLRPFNRLLALGVNAFFKHRHHSLQTYWGAVLEPARAGEPGADSGQLGSVTRGSLNRAITRRALPWSHASQPS